MLGVDCLRGIQNNEADTLCTTSDSEAAAESHGTRLFLLNVTVGLDIGQLLRWMDLPGVLYGAAGAAAGDSIIQDGNGYNDDDGRVRDYLWAFASLRRRAPSAAATGCVEGFYYSDSYGICKNPTFLDNGASISANGGLNTLTVPTPGPAAVWPTNTMLTTPGLYNGANLQPSANVYE